MYDLFNQPELSPKQEAIQSSYDYAGNDFREKADRFIAEYASKGIAFITEDVRIASIGIVPEPKETRAWGGAIVRAVKNGVIKWTGEYREMKSSHSHSCPKKVWIKK